MSVDGAGKGDPWIRIQFRSSVSQVNCVVKELLRFFEKQEKHTDLFALELVLREILVNAVTHGNKGDPNRIVDCAMAVASDLLTISVEDEGEGFDWQAEVQRDELNSWVTSGRGLLLARGYEFNLQFNERGNMIYLSKTLG